MDIIIKSKIMKLKQVTALVLTILTIVVGNYYYSQKNFQDGQSFIEVVGTKCGIIEDNFTELRNVKHGTRTDYFLKVRYSDATVIENVDAKTWYSSEEGKKVCFTITKGVSFWYILIFVVDYILICLLSIWILIFMVRWIFDCKPYNYFIE